MDWKLAAPDEYVCWCKKIDKATVVKAIQDGANTLVDIMNTTTAGTGSNCSTTNPSGKCCHQDIEELIAIYGKPLNNPPSRCCGTGCCS